MANMRCTVKFFLDQVTCPGTLHLPDRNPVYLTIFLFGRFQKSPRVYPSFPMCFTTKIKFQRLFTNAKTPEQVLEILEDETILIELRQYTKGLKGGRILAEFEESTRSFLFPMPSYIPKRNHLKRDVLLNRTDNFPIGKGLDPQFIFRTKTYIEEGPFIHNIQDIPVNRQIPASVSPSPKANNHNRSTIKSKEKKKKSSPQLRTSYISEQADMNDDKTDNVEAKNHCICDCPSLEEEPASIDHWLESLNKKKKKQSKVKPFRAGKAPKQLLSKREFTDTFKQEKDYAKKGICRYCVVPLPTCVLCNAYKTVYGPVSFLMHRFKKENIKKQAKIKRRSRDKHDTGVTSPGRGIASHQAYDSMKYYTPTKVGEQKVGESILKTDGNLKPKKSYSVMRYSGDDKDSIDNIKSDKSTVYPPRSSTRASSVNPLLMDERETKSVPPKSKPLFSPSRYRRNEEKLLSLESDGIHERIKNLMKKNNSVLQYDLSSLDSDDDLEIGELEIGEDSSSIESDVKSLASDKWTNLSVKNNELSHRDKLDSRLKEIYADLYQKTLNNN